MREVLLYRRRHRDCTTVFALTEPLPEIVGVRNEYWAVFYGSIGGRGWVLHTDRCGSTKTEYELAISEQNFTSALEATGLWRGKRDYHNFIDAPHYWVAVSSYEADKCISFNGPRIMHEIYLDEKSEDFELFTAVVRLVNKKLGTVFGDRSI